MKTIFSRAAAAATFFAALLCAGTAQAERPANLGGTTWTLQTNRDTVQLVITSQAGPGAPGAETCRHITGDIGKGAHPRLVRPLTGRIHFVHRNLGSGDAVRVFTGSVRRCDRAAALHERNDDGAGHRLR